MTAPAPAPASAARGAVARMWWGAVGFAAMALGVVGVIVPGLPSTVFFLAAAWCFARTSERLERWFLSLPGIGTMVRDHRDGLGMPKRAKVVSLLTMWTAIAISALALRDRAWLVAVIVVLGVIGSCVVIWRVPTKEQVLAARAG